MDFEVIGALIALTTMEIVLGIDNVVLLSILTERLPEKQQKPARQIGLLLAMAMRIGLLFGATWLLTLTKELFMIGSHSFTAKHLVFMIGGLFLIGKATHEIHKSMEGDPEAAHGKARATFGAVIVQVVIMDAVFSLDSVITAVGMADQLWVMVTAVVISIIVMIAFAEKVSSFIKRHPTTKMLALSFLLLIGVVLVADGLGKHIEKGYIYSAMAFSFIVEVLNLRVHAKRKARQTA
ncbi:MAG: TerC family protein [Planctomycetota bacterium]